MKIITFVEIDFMDESIDDLFKVQLTEKGAFHLQRFSKLVTAALIFLTIISILQLILCVKNIYLLFQYYMQEGYFRRLSLAFKLNWFLEVLVVVLNWIAVFYYYQFGARVHQAINDKNEISFNESFNLLFKNIIIFMAVLVINGFGITLSLIAM